MSNFWLSLVLAVCSSFAWVNLGHVRFEFDKMVRCGHGGWVRQSTSGTFTFPDLTQEYLTHTHMQREGNQKSSFRSAGTCLSLKQSSFQVTTKTLIFELQASPHGTSDTLMIYLAVVCGHGQWYRKKFIWAPLHAQIFTQKQTQNLQGKLKFSSVQTAGT